MLYFNEYQIMKYFSTILCQNIVEIMKLGKK